MLRSGWVVAGRTYSGSAGSCVALPVGVAAGSGVDLVGAGVGSGDGVAVGVDSVVVSPAEQRCVVDVGLPAVGPVGAVVGVAPCGWRVAAGPGAVPVADDDRAALGGG